MKTLKLLLTYLLVVFGFEAFSQASRADYDISVVLKPEIKTIFGTQKMKWTNGSNKPVNELQFHMYLNAFKDENSTFFKESGGMLRGDKMDTTQLRNFGNIYLSHFAMKSGESLLKKVEYFQPDDFNKNDKTVFKVKLNQSVKPGQTIELDIFFKAVLPKIFARTGWARDDFFMVGQWFPKIGVLEKDGTWNCHQFHGNTEFYSDFGTYNVSITLPERFVVGASGLKISEQRNKDKTKTFKYLAQNVHDFAWTASPKYIKTEKKYKGISITALMQPEHQYMVDRYFESAQNAISYMETHVGKYPHPSLVLVDPSLAASGAGGMEYPMLITLGSYWGIGKNIRMQEVVTIHEFVHQYFQGMLASNEFENSWMDEGFTQYFEGKIMDRFYPKGSQVDLLGFKLNDLAVSRSSYTGMDFPEITEIRRNSWQYPSGTYGVMSYFKTATWLKTLEGLLGEKNMMLLMKTYFERFKFRHPQPQDFINVANEIALRSTKFKDLNWFFDQVLYSSVSCDYTVGSLINAPRKIKPFGYFTIYRKGDMKMPVEAKVMFTDNTYQSISWDGQETSKKFRFSKRIKFVQIDPEYKNWMDLNMINNSISAKEPTKVASKFAVKVLFWVQKMLFWFGL
ncbi:MAG: M1 family metallopeptidase [Cytophagaceae bacterium]|nr:M1 family metallopeptidase [Cytophagaceae bacterium]MBL0325992.1 M1 family metallopeptidase [Cytophagaceae bacterium]